MATKETTLVFVDLLNMQTSSVEAGTRLDSARCLEDLAKATNAIPSEVKLVCMISPTDESGLTAAVENNYEVIPVNNKSQWVKKIEEIFYKVSPGHCIIVSGNPEWELYLERWSRYNNISATVWVPGDRVIPEFRPYHTKQLAEILPGTKTKRLGVWIDLENLFYGLLQAGIRFTPAEFVAAIKKLLAEEGEVISIEAYGDFEELSKSFDGLNVQRALVTLGVKTNYQVNMRGKNSADMALVTDIHNYLENPGPHPISKLVLVTRDRDFRKIIETAHSRGKTVVLIGMHTGMSNDLARTADKVLYLDDILRLGQKGTDSIGDNAAGNSEKIGLAMRLTNWMDSLHYTWSTPDRLARQFNGADVDLARKDGILVASTRPNAPEGALSLDAHNSSVVVARYLLRWGPQRVHYLVNVKGMPYCDLNYLVNGFRYDHFLSDHCIGQEWNEAENLLKQMVELGLLISERIPHPNNPLKTITVFTPPVPKTGASMADEASQVTNLPAPIVKPKEPGEVAAANIWRQTLS